MESPYMVLLDLPGQAVSSVVGQNTCLLPDQETPYPYLAINADEQVVAFSNACQPGILLWFYGTEANSVVNVPLDDDAFYLRFASDGTLVFLGQDNAIHFLDIATQQEIRRQATPSRPVSMLNDELVFLETPDYQYVAWDMENEEAVGEPLDAYPYLLSPDGYLIAGLAGDRVVIYGISEQAPSLEMQPIPDK